MISPRRIKEMEEMVRSVQSPGRHVRPSADRLARALHDAVSEILELRARLDHTDPCEDCIRRAGEGGGS